MLSTLITRKSKQTTDNNPTKRLNLAEHAYNTGIGTDNRQPTTVNSEQLQITNYKLQISRQFDY